jgi:hypothetical protein
MSNGDLQYKQQSAVVITPTQQNNYFAQQQIYPTFEIPNNKMGKVQA